MVTIEPYIRILLTKYRYGLHSLVISNEGYNDLGDRNNCPLYSMNSISDEYHYVMECPPFWNEWAKFIDPYLTRRAVVFTKELLLVN